MTIKIYFPLVLFLFLGSFSGVTNAGETLAWENCLAETSKNNPKLVSAMENVKEEEAAKDMTTSALLPQLDGSFGLGRTRTITQSTSEAKSTARQDSYSYGVTGSQLVFDGLKTFNNIKADSENVKAAKELYRFTSSEVRLDLRSAFINLLTAQELVRVTEEIVKIRQDNLDLIKLRYQSGLEHKGALLTAEANLAQADFELAQAGRNVGFRRTQLAKIMGRKEITPFTAVGDFTVRETAEEKPDLETLAKNNPSVLEAAFRKNSAYFDINSVYGDFMPSVSGTAGLSRSSDRNRTDIKWPKENDGWDVGLSVTMPLFEGGLKLAELSRTKAAYRKLDADEKDVLNSVVIGLESAWVNLRDAIENVDVQLKTLKALEERSDIAEAQYSTGFINFDNWIIIENDLVSAKKSYLQSQANSMLAESEWIQAKGETLEYAQ